MLGNHKRMERAISAKRKANFHIYVVLKSQFERLDDNADFQTQELQEILEEKEFTALEFMLKSSDSPEFEKSLKLLVKYAISCSLVIH